MDAFDDAFGSGPAEPESENTKKSNGNAFLLEDDVEADPAADFLAREQSNFAGLDDDDIPVVVATGGDSPLVSNGDFSNGNVMNENFDVGSEDNANINSNDDIFSDPPRASSPMSSSPSIFSMPREEPEKIRLWREEQKRRLEVKDAEEEESRDKLKAAAKKELDEWYKNYEDQLAKTKNSNRSAEKESASDDASSPGDEGKDWERIANLCDFNPKSTKQQKDISRMRSLILHLKQNPPVKRQSSAGTSNGS